MSVRGVMAGYLARVPVMHHGLGMKTQTCFPCGPWSATKASGVQGQWFSCAPILLLPLSCCITSAGSIELVACTRNFRCKELRSMPAMLVT